MEGKTIHNKGWKLHSPELDGYVLGSLPRLRRGARILDVGCGYGITGLLLRINYPAGLEITGVDGCGEYIRFVQRHRIYDHTAQQVFPPLEQTTERFDVVLLLDVLEHIPQEKGVEMLGELERVCAEGGRIIVLTPTDALRTKTVYPENPLSAHISTWTPEVFKGRGYKVRLIQYWHLTRLLALVDRIKRKLLRLHSAQKIILATKDKGGGEK